MGMTKNKSGERVKCLGGCGRMLKAKASVARGRGPKCQARYEREIEAALETLAAYLAEAYTAEQVSKATELIEESGIVDHGVPAFRIGAQHRYLAVSSDGAKRYQTTADSCTCKAGQYGRRCYHRAAATILDVAAEVAA